jgi:putative (di)nucleoside polyphosphate hydrolase
MTQHPDTFRAGVGAVIVDPLGRVLAFQRAGHDGAWQLPQGGINASETTVDALWREIREETGLTKHDLQIVSEIPVWLGYELPVDTRSPKTGRGQTHRWFILSPKHPNIAQNIHFESTEHELIACEWMTWDTLIERAVAFRKPVYALLQTYLTEPKT